MLVFLILVVDGVEGLFGDGVEAAVFDACFDETHGGRLMVLFDWRRG